MHGVVTVDTLGIHLPQHGVPVLQEGGRECPGAQADPSDKF